jgi:transposase
LYDLLDFAYYCELDINNSFLTLDTGFDSKFNRELISEFNLIPVIKPNRRGLKDRTKIYKHLDNFERYKHIYERRYIIERCFAWEDKYRKLVIRYERLQATHLGFKYLAFSMINFRWFFGGN